MSGIKVGDTVRVTNDGLTFRSYGKWAERHNLTKWRAFGHLNKGDVGTVVAVGPHSLACTPSTWDNLCAVESNGKQVIIGEKGLELVVAAPANGVDAEGNPKNFTEADFKINQRVVTRDGTKFVVAQGVHEVGEGLVLIGPNSWNQLRMIWGSEPSCDIVEVYDATAYNCDLLDITKRGELIWKLADPVKVQKRKQLEADIATAQAALAALGDD